MGTLTDAVISTTYKKLVFQNTDNKLYYTNASDVDTEITTFASPITMSGLMTASLGVKLGNNIIYANDGGQTITLDASDNVAITADLIVTGNDIKSGTIGSNTTAITLSGANVTIAGDLTITGGNITNAITCDSTLTVASDLTVEGDDIVIGGSDDATDKSINFRHDSCEVFMGIDDSQESNAGAFIIHTGTAFQATKLDNDFLIDGSGNVHIGNGELRLTKIAFTDGDDALTVNDGGSLTSSGLLTLGGNLIIPDNGYIGTASDTDAIRISSTGAVTMTQNMVNSASSGASTFAARVYLNGNTANVHGAGIDSDNSRCKAWIQKLGNVFHTSIYVDLEGLASVAVDKDVIGLAAGGVAYIGKIFSTGTASNGAIFAVKMTCLEVPAGGSLDIDLYNADEGTWAYNDALVTGSGTEYAIVDAGGNWANGDVKGGTTITFGSTEFLYLVNGAGSGAGTYTAGKFLIELWGV